MKNKSTDQNEELSWLSSLKIIPDFPGKYLKPAKFRDRKIWRKGGTQENLEPLAHSPRTAQWDGERI